MEYIVNKDKMTAMEKIVFRAPTKHKVTTVIMTILAYAAIASSLYLFVRSVIAGFMTEVDFKLCITALSATFVSYGLCLLSGKKYNHTFSDFRLDEKLSVTNNYIKYRFYSKVDHCFVKYEFSLDDVISVEKHPEANMFRVHGNIQAQIVDDEGDPLQADEQTVNDISISDYFDGLDLASFFSDFISI